MTFEDPEKPRPLPFEPDAHSIAISAETKECIDKFNDLTRRFELVEKNKLSNTIPDKKEHKYDEVSDINAKNENRRWLRAQWTESGNKGKMPESFSIKLAFISYLLLSSSNI